MKKDMLKQSGSAMKTQKDQLMSVEEQKNQVEDVLNQLSDANDSNLQDLDLLIQQANQLCEDNVTLDSDFANEINEQLKQIESTKLQTKSNVDIQLTNTVEYGDDWDSYIDSVMEYANNHHLDLRDDPYMSLMSESQRNSLVEMVQNDYYTHKPEMDRYDYIIAAFCGVASGLIDSFFVGRPGQSKFQNIADKEVDKIIIKLAEFKGWKPQSAEKRTVANAIQQFEQWYGMGNRKDISNYLKHGGINYDQHNSKMTDNLVTNMTSSNHHIRSLAHAPDIVGLIFSIIDQFTNQSHFFEKGKLISIRADSTLQGSNLVSKLFAGIANWLGHCISDVTGSSPNRRSNPNSRGSGISIPFFELFQFADKGSIGEDKLTIAETAVKMFEEGYDFRFGLAMSIPVFINEMSIRLFWMLKRHYYHHEPLKKCVPIVLARELTNKESNAIILRRMLLAGEGSLCLVDFGDAAVRAKGVDATTYTIDFLLHLNFKAWKKFAVNLAISGVMEVRLNYNCNHIDIDKLNDDLLVEWDRLVEAI